MSGRARSGVGDESLHWWHCPSLLRVENRRHRAEGTATETVCRASRRGDVLSTYGILTVSYRRRTWHVSKALAGRNAQYIYICSMHRMRGLPRGAARSDLGTHSWVHSTVHGLRLYTASGSADPASRAEARRTQEQGEGLHL